MSTDHLAAIRRAYAKHLAFMSRWDDPRLEDAFAAVRREDFMGPGPWLVPSIPKGHRLTPDADPARLYQDLLVALKPAKQLNNGQPTFLAYLVGLGRIAPGEHVVHVGAGVGYYTAVMAELAGPSGTVTAIEYEPDLAAKAAANLAPWPSVRVIRGDATRLALPPADVILVNAGAACPAAAWLDALKDGGRLIIPLTANAPQFGRNGTAGAIFLIERHGRRFSARWKSQTGIYPCIGARDPEDEKRLAQAFRKGRADKVRRLIRGGAPVEEECWVRGDGWALAFAPGRRRADDAKGG
jgi:protein-L-isoaspartate(D-aspartate) O-methyltransferase